MSKIDVKRKLPVDSPNFRKGDLSMSDLIAAIATPPGRGGVGILRQSGPGAAETAGQVFRPAGKTALADAPDRQLLYGQMVDGGGRILDSGLAFVSRAPHSYTGEDTAELQCHGSPMVLSLLLEAVTARGARLAGPGEFTRRAFLNGKLDLTRAEGVIDLIDAETPAAARQAANQLSGALFRRAETIYSALVDLSAHFHAVLDYPDEDLDPFRVETMAQVLRDQADALEKLSATQRRGLAVKNGVLCAIVGRPNAGKSSLLNALAGYQRAIVTDIPGTTRDTVEVKVELAGVPFRLVDTAGVRESDDPIEQMGVERSRQAMEEASLILVVWDGSQPVTGEDRAILAQPKIVVLDEATASVDTLTEQKIQAAIDTVIRGRTSIVIAHRLSTVKDADIILVVQDGKIIEQGRHEELLAAKGHYYDLWTRQYEDAAIAEAWKEQKK